MILSSSGQNIFPEEIEARLNNMPFVLESLVIERNKKLVALVYADYEALDSLGLNNPENIKTIMDENLKNLNNSVAARDKGLPHRRHDIGFGAVIAEGVAHRHRVGNLCCR